jgi:PadR family transcriptional regulator, regulatory protein AphA
MELSPTAYVILGLLAWWPMSGYDIKATVDASTRNFWAASYGQIYPELRRLAEAGLVEEAGEPEGARRRTVYRLTAAGRAELREWLAQPARTFEVRDEALLKLFLADSAPETAATSLDAKRANHEAKLERLRATQAREQPSGYSALVLRYGIELNEWIAAWCEREAKRERGA